jgi:hypothetical protein
MSMGRTNWILLTFLSLLTTATLAQTADGDVYEIDAARSDIHWQVYKAGAFARFGHNHVISVGTPSGRISVAEVLADSRVEMHIPVGELVVDNPQLRKGKGEDFASEPSDEDIEGTRGNMLSEGVLNGAQFPEIRVSGTNLSGLGANATIDLTIDLLGRSVTHTVPTSVVVEGDGLIATGEFALQHADLGMKPFSVMMGALQVGDQLDFIYRVHANKVD